MSNMQVFTPKNMAPQLTACSENTTNSLYWTAMKEMGNAVLSGAETARTGLN